MSEKPTIADMVQNAITSRLLDVHTSLPAKIESYSNGKADVSILLKKKVGDELIDIPKITDVPVLQPRSAAGTSFLSMPIKKGDTGLLIFCERSLDKWLLNGGSVDPISDRKFDYSDAIFLPGLYEFSKPMKPSNSNATELTNVKASIILHPNGKIEFKGLGGDIVSIISDILTHLIGAKVITALGLSPFAPDTIANLTADKAKIDLIKK